MMYLVTSIAINKFEKKSLKGAVKAGKRFNLFITNEDMNDIIKIMKSLEVRVYQLMELLKQ